MSITLSRQASPGTPTLQPMRAILYRLSMRLYGSLKLASQRCAIRRARRELLELPDFMLKDLGINRTEIGYIVEHGRTDTTRLPRFIERSGEL